MTLYDCTIINDGVLVNRDCVNGLQLKINIYPVPSDETLNQIVDAIGNTIVEYVGDV